MNRTWKPGDDPAPLEELRRQLAAELPVLILTKEVQDETGRTWAPNTPVRCIDADEDEALVEVIGDADQTAMIIPSTHYRPKDRKKRGPRPKPIPRKEVRQQKLRRRKQRRQLVTRYIEDVDGNLVTYLPRTECAVLVAISTSTLHRWEETNAIRHVPMLRGICYDSVLDAAELKLRDARDTQAAGIRRVPDDDLAYSKTWQQAKREKTLPGASNLGEVWDEFDYILMMTMLDDGKSLEDIANATSRTYDAVAAAVYRLRQWGDLPPFFAADKDWLKRTLGILTSEEAEVLRHDAEEVQLLA